MKKMVLCAVLLATFGVNAASSEAECEPQASVAFDLKKMIDEGALPNVDSTTVNRLNDALEHYKNGEYCAARSIVLSLNDNK